MKKPVRIIFKIILTITVIIGVVDTAYNAILIYNTPATSFPWTTALYFPGIIYLIIFALEVIIYTILKKIFSSRNL